MAKPRITAGHRQGEIINDIDDEIVDVYRALRDRTDDLIQAVIDTPWSRSEYVDACTLARSDDIVERARRTLVRFQGGIASGGCDPKGSDWLNDTKRARNWRSRPFHLTRFADRLRDVIIENNCATKLIRQFDSPDTLHYCDPPYPISTRQSTRTYPHEMSDDDHRELAAVLRSVEGMVVMSGYPCELYNELYHDWTEVTLEQTKIVAFNAKAPQPERIWLSPSCEKRKTDLFYSVSENQSPIF